MASLWDTWRSYWGTDAPPPPPTRSAPLSPSPFSRLPPELILYILTLSLPAPSYQSLSLFSSRTSRTSRTSRLVQFAALHPHYHSHFTRLSHLDIHLPTLHSAAHFLHQSHHQAWAHSVKSLRLGSCQQGATTIAINHQWQGDGAVIGELFRVCTQLEELYITGFAGLDLSYLRGGYKLRILYLNETRLTLNAPPTTTTTSESPLLPNLTHLHLRSTIFSGISLPYLLSPESLPSLTTLDYLSVHQSLVPLGAGVLGTTTSTLTQLTSTLSPPPLTTTQTQPHGNHHPIHLLLPQIKHLALGSYLTKTLSPLEITLCTRLETLDLPLSMGIDMIKRRRGHHNDWDWSTSLQAVRWRGNGNDLNSEEEVKEDQEGLVQQVLENSLEWFSRGGGGGVVVGDVDSFQGGGEGGGNGNGKRIRKVILTLPPSSHSSTSSLSSSSSFSTNNPTSTSTPSTSHSPTHKPSTNEIIHHHHPSPPAIEIQFQIWRGGCWEKVDNPNQQHDINPPELWDGPFDLSFQIWRQAVARARIE